MLILTGVLAAAWAVLTLIVIAGLYVPSTLMVSMLYLLISLMLIEQFARKYKEYKIKKVIEEAVGDITEFFGFDKEDK